MAALCACWACTDKLSEAEPAQESADQEQISQKILFKGETAVSNQAFLVKFAVKPTQEQVETLLGNGTVSVQPYFPHMPGKEALEAQFGLDRWYEVTVEEGASLDAKVLEAAALKQVSVVQYKLQYSIPENEFMTVPAQEYPDTKGTLSFNNFSDPMIGDQWHYINTGNEKYGTGAVKGADVNVKDVWARLICGDESIVIAVVDKGVKNTHPDLKDNIWINADEIPGNGIDDDHNGYIDDVYGYNFVSKTGFIDWVKPDSYGDSSHGTHCAGTIAAVNNNGRGVAGLAGGTGKKDGCKIMSCQIFEGTAGGDAAKAIKYAADNGASIISCSFGYDSSISSDNAFIKRFGSAEIDAIRYFENTKGNNTVLDGNIAIFAAGNEQHDFAHYPGAFVDIISVSAFAANYMPAYYTNYGPGCNIAAPGGDMKLNYQYGGVLSTVCSETENGNDYGYMQGTSMACPHVSGVVALALSYAKQIGKKFTVNEFKQLILASTDDIDQRIANTTLDGYAKYYHQMGTGAIDAWRLMMNIEGIPSSTAAVGKKQWISLESALGSSSVSLSYLDVVIPQATIDALGLQKIQGTSDSKYPATPAGECYGYVQFGRLYIHPTKVGSGTMTIKVIGGGDHLGGGDNPPGGMEIDRKISVIAREADGGNGTGGWL